MTHEEQRNNTRDKKNCTDIGFSESKINKNNQLTNIINNIAQTTLHSEETKYFHCKQNNFDFEWLFGSIKLEWSARRHSIKWISVSKSNEFGSVLSVTLKTSKNLTFHCSFLHFWFRNMLNCLRFKPQNVISVFATSTWHVTVFSPFFFVFFYCKSKIGLSFVWKCVHRENDVKFRYCCRFIRFNGWIKKSDTNSNWEMATLFWSDTRVALWLVVGRRSFMHMLEKNRHNTSQNNREEKGKRKKSNENKNDFPRSFACYTNFMYSRHKILCTSAVYATVASSCSFSFFHIVSVVRIENYLFPAFDEHFIFLSVVAFFASRILPIRTRK